MRCAIKQAVDKLLGIRPGASYADVVMSKALGASYAPELRQTALVYSARCVAPHSRWRCPARKAHELGQDQQRVDAPHAVKLCTLAGAAQREEPQISGRTSRVSRFRAL